MSLRDGLAARLLTVWENEKGFIAGPQMSDFDRFRLVADEVIRQMEWARRQVPTWLSRAGLAKINLAIAPEDWKP